MSLTTRTEETVYLHPQYIGKIGVVQDFTTDGDVVVEYRDRSWRYNPAALTKVMPTQPFASPRSPYWQLVNFILVLREPLLVFFSVDVNIGIRYIRSGLSDQEISYFT